MDLEADAMSNKVSGVQGVDGESEACPYPADMIVSFWTIAIAKPGTWCSFIKSSTWEGNPAELKRSIVTDILAMSDVNESYSGLDQFVWP